MSERDIISHFDPGALLKQYPSAKDLATICKLESVQDTSEKVNVNTMEIEENHAEKSSQILERPENESFSQRRKRQEEFQKVRKKHVIKMSRLSTEISSNPTPISIENKFQPLTTIDMHSEDKTTTTLASEHTSAVKHSISTPIMTSKLTESNQKKPKPIILVTKVQYFRLREIFLQMLSQIPVCQYCPKGLKIQPQTEEDAQKIMKYFQSQQMEFYTFISGQYKTMKVVMRGLPIDTPTAEIDKELRLLKYPIENVRQMRRRVEDEQTGNKVWKPMPLWVVTVYDIQNVPNIWQLTGLYNLKISLSEYVGQGGPQQCYNCQGFGHKADGCFITPKCVKCGENHVSRECNKNPQDPPRCANCNKTHPANYRQCQKFVAYTNGRRYENATHKRDDIPSSKDFPALPQKERILPSRQPRHEIPRGTNYTTNSTIEDFRDMMDFIKGILNGFRTVCQQMKNEPDPLSRLLILANGVSNIFADGD